MQSNKESNSKKLDSYSLLIVSKYFIEKEDYINIICVNSKFKETTEKLRFNPISINSLKLFPKIQTQYLYTKDDSIIKGIDKYEVLYEIDYGDYLEYNKDNVKCHHVIYTHKNRIEYGKEIVDDVSKLNDKCLKNSPKESIELPNHITFIGINCFSNSYSLQKIIFPTSLSKINDKCCWSCNNLTLIKFPSTIQSLGIECFYNCKSLTSIDLPSTITSIGNGCFSNCSSLQSIILPLSIKVLEKYMFNECNSLTNVVLPSTLIVIGNGCFSKCYNLLTLSLPSSLKRLGDLCFSLCGLTSIIIPKFIQVIGINCFNLCSSLTSIKFESNINTFSFKVSFYDSILYKQNNINCTRVALTIQDVTQQLLQMKQQKIDINDYNIPNTIVELGCFVFIHRHITSINIPTSVTSISYNSFKNCSSLQSIIIPTTVKSVDISCFEKCNNLKQLSLPLNDDKKYPFKLSYEEYLIFKRCGIKCSKVIIRNLLNDNESSCKIPMDIPLIFDIFHKTSEITIPTICISLKSNHLSHTIKNCTIPTSVSKLCNNCFENYTDLQSITISSSIQYIGKHIIDGCVSLTKLNYDGDWNNIIVSYDDYLRYKSNGLLFNNIEYTYNDTKKYGNVIPSIVHSVHQSYYERSNEMIHIPTHITSLDNNMFQSLYGISSLLRNIILPTSITIIPKYCFSKCYLLTYVELPSTIISIKKNSFEHCISLQSLLIPKSVNNIEKHTFEGCYSLTLFTLQSIPTFGDECFKGCTQLKDILNIPDYYF